MAAKNEYYTDFRNRRPYNNIPCKPGEILVPVVVAGDLEITLKDSGLDRNNMETWHFQCAEKPVPVAFVQVSESSKKLMQKEFNRQVHVFLNGDKNLFQEEELASTDQLLDAVADEDEKGYDPMGSTEDADKAYLDLVLEMLIEDLNRLDENYGRTIGLLSEGYSKGDILGLLDLETGKSQGYVFIKNAQKTARDFYDDKYRG